MKIKRAVQSAATFALGAVSAVQLVYMYTVDLYKARQRRVLFPFIRDLFLPMHTRQEKDRGISLVPESRVSHLRSKSENLLLSGFEYFGQPEAALFFIQIDSSSKTLLAAENVTSSLSSNSCFVLLLF